MSSQRLNLALLCTGLSLATCACSRQAATDADRRTRIEELYVSYKAQFEGTPEMTVAELVARPDRDDLVLVDVRKPEEQHVSMLPGAITVTALESRPDAYRAGVIVTYCTIGARSGEYAAALRERGFDAYNLRGSLLAWAHAGQPLVTATGTTRRAHVYGARWALLPEGYESVW